LTLCVALKFITPEFSQNHFSCRCNMTYTMMVRHETKHGMSLYDLSFIVFLFVVVVLCRIDTSADVSKLKIISLSCFMLNSVSSGVSGCRQYLVFTTTIHEQAQWNRKEKKRRQNLQKWKCFKLGMMFCSWTVIVIELESKQNETTEYIVKQITMIIKNGNLCKMTSTWRRFVSFINVI
jgi:hypothetical protein